MDRTEPSLIFETVHGSAAYGLNRQDSDIDLKGVIVGPKSWYFGYATAPEQIELSADHVRYDVRKMIRLAADANPTLLEILFTDPKHHVTVTPSGQMLLDARNLFLSTKVADRFGGYAASQLKRIDTHRAWLLSPPSAAPIRSDFGLPEQTVIPADQFVAAESLLEDGNLRDADVSSNFLELLYRERRYKAAAVHWAQYQSWTKHRNPKRSELEAKYGYDTKHGMHLVRLLRMGIEILTTGDVHVTRPDRDELLGIRDGKWTYDQLRAYSDDAKAELETARRVSTLPLKPDHQVLGELCMNIIQRELA